MGLKDSTSCSKAGFSPHTEEGWSCCPKGWKRFQGSCYYLSDDVMSWAASEQNCTGMGSHLVVINSKAEQVLRKCV
uniref:C-type lectin domain-containing protein n=1 Tax=Strigops habroptila TaxID=2489341 RepID=A0A672V4T0_STRHB